MNSSPLKTAAPTVEPLRPSDEPTVSGTWQYNGFSLGWQTSNPYSVTLSVQEGSAAPVPQTLTRSAPQALLQGAPMKTEARLGFSSQIHMGSSGTASLILLIQLSPDILFRTTIGGWAINKSPDQPDTLSPWWLMQSQPTQDDEPLPCESSAPAVGSGNPDLLP